MPLATQTTHDFRGDRLSVRMMGAKGDGQTGAGSISASSHTLTLTSGSFSALDVGAMISIFGAAGSGSSLTTTITAVGGSTSATLAVAASTSVTGSFLVWGTDDHAAIQAGIDANETANIFFPIGIYLCSQTLVLSNLGPPLRYFQGQIVGAGKLTTFIYFTNHTATLTTDANMPHGFACWNRVQNSSIPASEIGGVRHVNITGMTICSPDGGCGIFMGNTGMLQISCRFISMCGLQAIAQITGTFASNPSNGNTCTIGGKTYTFQTVLTNSDGNVLIGASTDETLGNLGSAVNLAGGAGVVYATATTVNPNCAVVDHGVQTGSASILVSALLAGVAGNSLTASGLATWSNGGAFIGGAASPRHHTVADCCINMQWNTCVFEGAVVMGCISIIQTFDTSTGHVVYTLASVGGSGYFNDSPRIKYCEFESSAFACIIDMGCGSFTNRTVKYNISGNMKKAVFYAIGTGNRGVVESNWSEQSPIFIGDFDPTQPGNIFGSGVPFSYFQTKGYIGPPVIVTQGPEGLSVIRNECSNFFFALFTSGTEMVWDGNRFNRGFAHGFAVWAPFSDSPFGVDWYENNESLANDPTFGIFHGLYPRSFLSQKVPTQQMIAPANHVVDGSGIEALVFKQVCDVAPDNTIGRVLRLRYAPVPSFFTTINGTWEVDVSFWGSVSQPASRIIACFELILDTAFPNNPIVTNARVTHRSTSILLPLSATNQPQISVISSTDAQGAFIDVTILSPSATANGTAQLTFSGGFPFNLANIITVTPTASGVGGSTNWIGILTGSINTATYDISLAGGIWAVNGRTFSALPLLLNDLYLNQLPPRSKVVNMTIKTVTAFTGPGLTSLTAKSASFNGGDGFFSQVSYDLLVTASHTNFIDIDCGSSSYTDQTDAVGVAIVCNESLATSGLAGALKVDLSWITLP